MATNTTCTLCYACGDEVGDCVCLPKPQPSDVCIEDLVMKFHGSTYQSSKNITYVQPSYQRDMRWSVAQQVALIKSVIRNVSIGTITVVTPESGTESGITTRSRRKSLNVCDGLSRLRTLCAYVRGTLEYNSEKFTDLSTEKQLMFKSKSVHILTYGGWEPKQVQLTPAQEEFLFNQKQEGTRMSTGDHIRAMECDVICHIKQQVKNCPRLKELLRNIWQKKYTDTDHATVYCLVAYLLCTHPQKFYDLNVHLITFVENYRNKRFADELMRDLTITGLSKRALSELFILMLKVTKIISKKVDDLDKHNPVIDRCKSFKGKLTAKETLSLMRFSRDYQIDDEQFLERFTIMLLTATDPLRSQWKGTFKSNGLSKKQSDLRLCLLKKIYLKRKC